MMAYRIFSDLLSGRWISSVRASESWYYPILSSGALSIYLTDRGPVFYKQTRLTEGGKEFQICKFRTMIQNAEAKTGARLAAEHDDRILPVGHFLRRTRLDELPQLFNIWKGEMSIVGRVRNARSWRRRSRKKSRNSATA